MVVVAGEIGVGAVLDFAGLVAKAVPDGFAFPVFMPRALNLEGSCGGPPVEIFGERNSGR
jgi:hypothetical protein